MHVITSISSLGMQGLVELFMNAIATAVATLALHHPSTYPYATHSKSDDSLEQLRPPARHTL